MKTWEQAEFEAQQEAIREWAEKKLLKICNGWLFTRKCRKIQRLAGIVFGNPDAPFSLKIRKNYKSGVNLEIRRSYMSGVKIDEREG